METLYQIALTLIPGIGDITAKRLVSYCGGVEAVFREKGRNLLKIPNVGDAIAKAVAEANPFARAEKELAFIERYKIQPLFYLSPDYPQRLKQCTDSPVMLYYKGNANLNHEKIVAIVGTRNASEYGKEVTEKLVRDLVSDNVLIASGLAYGIDTSSHKAAVELGLPTVGVLGHGLDRIYPFQNRTLAERMLENGGLLTEFLSESKPDRENFPKRNRIIAGMCDALVVVEAAKSGGALITAEIANSYNRDVFAVPGKLTDNYSEGCNYFIKTNKAALLQNADDIRYFMGWKKDASLSKQIQKSLFIELSGDERVIYDYLNLNGESSMDDLCLTLKLSTSKIAAALLNLEFQGIIRAMPGKRFKLD
jgi:DNA processing protein